MCLDRFMPPRTSTYVVNGFTVAELRKRDPEQFPTQGDLADAIGVTRSYVTNIENGRAVRIGPKVFVALVKALDVKDKRALLADPHSAEQQGAA